MDHDIDIGETWTQTIEGKLDAAGALIVAMSPSARTSVWVSREIARAERKGKPIFPLLLAGEPLLQFETTQYVDVSDGSLPSPRFADSIASALGITLRSLGSDLLDVVARYRESGVLILGRFTGERKSVLDAFRDTLRKQGFIPVFLDFSLPTSMDVYETLLLFSLAVRFIIADLTDSRSVPYELAQIVPVTRVLLVPIIQEGNTPFAMFLDISRQYPWVTPII